MPRCTRKGCGREYSDDSEEQCEFHPGAPVFHEGLKSWSCCSDVYKPVLDFDEFLKLPGCTRTERHTSANVSSPSAVTPATVPCSKPTTSSPVAAPAPPSRQESFATQTMSPAAPAPISHVEEEDDPTQAVILGTVCRRRGCGAKFVSDEVNRLGSGEGTICKYHPAPPIFREGSKGYLCCKPRVLEFEEFLKIEGCKVGRHVFVVKPQDHAEETTVCRIDHYQTVDTVYVSVFAKHADKERSRIQMNDDQITLDLALPGAKRFVRTLNLFGTIDPSASTHHFFGTKVELNLKKKDGKSWTLLERTTQDLGNIRLTFGVSGRTGTIGGKEPVLDQSNTSEKA